MFTTTTRTRTVAATGALTLASVVLAAAGAAQSAGSAAGDASHDGDRIARQARAYVGDPWEQRYRDQFWQTQHIHDSWNPCHIGENVPRRLQGHGPQCWDRLPGQG